MKSQYPDEFFFRKKGEGVLIFYSDISQWEENQEGGKFLYCQNESRIFVFFFVSLHASLRSLPENRQGGKSPPFPRVLIMPFFSLLLIELGRFMLFSNRLTAGNIFIHAPVIH